MKRLGGAFVVVVSLVSLLAPNASAADPTVVRVSGADRIATAVAISQTTYEQADVAVLARADEFADALTAGPLAVAVGGPLLLTDPEALPALVDEELARLGASKVLVLGGDRAVSEKVVDALDDGREVERLAGDDRYATAAEVSRRLDGSGVMIADGRGFADALAAGPVAAASGDPLLLVDDRLPSSTAEVLEERRPSSVIVAGGPAAVSQAVFEEIGDLLPDSDIVRVGGVSRWHTAALLFDRSPTDLAEIWLATGTDFADALSAGPAVVASGARLLLVDGSDLRAAQPAVDRLRHHASSLRTIRLVGGPGAVTEHADWQLDGILTGPALPSGRHLVFSERRLVALYGHHRAPAMGVLGEQPPDEAADRTARVAAPYATESRPVQTAFDLIVSVATAEAGSDGDYSSPSTIEQIRPWLEAARRHGVYLILDIQPGRSDFPTEVRRYEDLLREPEVGLALDPEWRMGPDEVPAETIGSVDASEVNEVTDWLATIVREERLPQKLLIVHQFRHDMITNRHALRTTPELALLIQMDGQGGRGQKLDTYRAVSVTDGRWHNGFKLFYDEDRDLFQPSEVLALEPVPDFVSYQ